MWVFGYGSLMWDGWETKHGCIRRVLADLPGYCRTFNKASVRNWGTKSAPCPTLNLSKVAGSVCRGIAFEFPDAQKAEILSYLKEREGKAFPLHEVPVHLEDQSDVSAFVPIYSGKNVIEGNTLEKVVSMVLAASGTNGTCLAYIKGIAEKLSALGINDPAVSELWGKVIHHHPKDYVTPEMERRVEALGFIHYHYLRTRRISYVLGPVALIAAVVGTVLWSWVAILVVIAVYFIYSSVVSLRTTRLIEAKTGFSALEQRELLRNPEVVLGASAHDKELL